MPSNPNRFESEFWRCSKCGIPNPVASYLTHCLGCSSPRPPSRIGSTSRTFAVNRPTPDRSRVDRRFRRFIRTFIPLGSWALLGLIVLAWVFIRRRGDVDFLPTLLLFAPRLLAVLPILLLAVAAGRLRQPRLWIIHAITLVFVLGPFMDFNLPFDQSDSPATPSELSFGVLTLNRGKQPLDAYTFRRLLDRENIQVVFFQEDPVDLKILEGLPADLWTYNKDKTLATRFRIVREWDFPDRWEHEYPIWAARMSRTVLKTPGGVEFHAASVYMPSMMPGFHRLFRSFDPFGLLRIPNPPVSPGTEHLARKGVAGFLRQLAWRRKQFRSLLEGLDEFRDLPLLVGGDLNTPADSRMLDPLKRSFHFAFEDAGFGYGYTRPTTLPWTRIDHILGDRNWSFVDCRVGPAVGSDHLPLLAHVILRGRPAAKP